jgi:hypothetical protein
MTAIIQPSNAVYASHYLLNLDSRFIDYKYQRVAAPIVKQLKDARHRYLGSVSKPRFSPERIETQLTLLTEAANFLAYMLSKESQECLLADLSLYREEMH